MKTEPIYVFAKWQVQTGRLEEVLGLLREVAGQSTREPGNLLYKIHQSTADKNTLLLYEAYRDEPALAAHRDTEHFKSLVLGKIIPLLEHREVVLTRSIHAS
ncbi:MAG: putative quinol monooxygenase [Rariglobus sp.]